MPEISFDNTFDKVAALYYEEFTNHGLSYNNSSPFGAMVVVQRAATPTDATYPRESIASAADLSQQWASIIQIATEVQSEGYEYRPLSQNSNTFAGVALQNAGLPLPTRFPDNSTDFLPTPGVNRELKNPLTGPSGPEPYDPNLGAYDFWDLNYEKFFQAIDKDLPKDAAFKKKIISPLVIDLDGAGVELISLEDSAAFFDLNLDGFAEMTGWVSADDALLALDVDGDGIIDNSSELFGDQTGHANGFLALAAHDGNGDGVIDANDAVFADLIAWRDLNGDGFSAESEMVSPTDVGITSIDLAYVDVNETNAGAARQIRTNLS